jgi:hypothetical protein
MKTRLWRVTVSVIILSLAGELAVDAKPKPKKGAPVALTLPTVGTFADGGEFTGGVSINRFEQRGDQIVAIGFVSGVLSRRGLRLGTAVVGEVVWPVILMSGGLQLASGQASGTGRPARIAWSPGAGSAFRLRPVQAESCEVIDLALGAINVDVLGLQVALSPVAFNLVGVVGTPLGDLVCEVSDLLGNVAGLVGVLNALLSLLTGLLGGLLGGIGGAIPGA